VNKLVTLFLFVYTVSAFADPGFNRCKKFITYPAPPVFDQSAKLPDRNQLPPSSALLLSARLGLNPDAKADYSGRFKVLEIQEEPGYHYYFWDLKSGYILPGPVSAAPALWRQDSRLFIAPKSTQEASNFNHLGYIGEDFNDSATYYLLNDNQKHPEQTLIEILNCPSR
jgi:hypothetical protein